MQGLLLPVNLKKPSLAQFGSWKDWLHSVKQLHFFNVYSGLTSMKRAKQNKKQTNKKTSQAADKN